MNDLELALRELDVDWPATPDIAAAVQRPDRRRAARRGAARGAPRPAAAHARSPASPPRPS